MKWCTAVLFTDLLNLVSPLLSQVKEKRRSPPSDRPPTAPHANPHHSASPEDQESPERVVSGDCLDTLTHSSQGRIGYGEL